MWPLADLSAALFADPSFPDPGTDPGFPPIPGWFFVPIILVLAIGVGSAMLRYSTGRRIAERAGLDPEDAGMTSLLSENGLPAAYVMSNLPGRTAPASPRTVESRLAELKGLHDKGLVSPEEYAARRTAILDEV